MHKLNDSHFAMPQSHNNKWTQNDKRNNQDSCWMFDINID